MDTPHSPEVTATSIPHTLSAVLMRLDILSQDLSFQPEREAALAHFLQPYTESADALYLRALPEEMELAKLHLYCDYFPAQGQFSLIEQLRDHITEHVPEEERVWLDPLRHSFMDVLEVLKIGFPGAPYDVQLRSLGDKIEYVVTSANLAQRYQAGHVLITRLIRRPECTVYPGVAIGLSPQRGRLLFESLRDLQREMEAFSGAFELAEWQEYVKRYGHIIIWTLANLRMKWLVELENQVRFIRPDGHPFFHCLAIYEHHARDTFQATLTDDKDWTPVTQITSIPPGSDTTTGPAPSARRVWTTHTDGPSRYQDGIIGTLTLTNTQLIAEADSLEHLNELKHWLASTFGFNLHFRGENLQPPFHAPPTFDLLVDQCPEITETVTREEEHRILSALWEGAYLDWAERPCPALQDKTPRHCALTPQGTKDVSALIQELENHDIAKLRTGKLGFDYDTLRSHVGLL